MEEFKRERSNTAKSIWTLPDLTSNERLKNFVAQSKNKEQFQPPS